MPRSTAVAIRGKYAEMLALRVEHAAGRENVAQLKPRLSRLATTFPGALREIDRLELAEIERRLARLDAVLDGGGGDAAEEPWMMAVALFHRLARGALGAKRWLAGRRSVDAATRVAFLADAQGHPFQEEIRAWESDLASVASPPRGRLMDLVFSRLAREIGASEAEARRLVFGG
jgi:hypothetical protein